MRLIMIYIEEHRDVWIDKQTISRQGVKMGKDTNKPKIRTVIGGIADGEETQTFLDELANTKDKSFDEYVIVYIDFLGMKEKMNIQSGFDSLQIIKYLLYNTEYVAKCISQINKIQDFIIKIFSDNIVIAQKVNPQIVGDQINSIVNLVWSLQFWALVQFGYTMRGGITVGELYIDERVVWGKGLIEAYQLENDLAVYPRIIVSRRLVNLFDDNRENTLNLYALIKKDFDGLFFVDFLRALPNINAIPQIAESLLEKTQEYKEAPERVRQKINWIVRYFNEYCSAYKDRLDTEVGFLEYV